MSLLKAAGVCVTRGGRLILDHASVAFSSGALYAVIGPNGAGKSTLLSTLAGLLEPDQGQVSLDGTPLAGIDRKALARRRAYLPQNPRAEWPNSVERLVALGLTPSLPAFGDLPREVEDKVDRAIRACDLEDRRAQAATTLSGGELSRAMLARALVGDPDILIADEPVAGLDPRHALDALIRLRRLADNGKLVVVSLHDLTLAARYATHVLALDGGKVVADGPTVSTLTAAMLKTLFGVEARLRGQGPEASVDFLPLA